MRKFFFVICSLAMASAIVGLSRAVIAMVEGNWQAFGDANLLWLQWANDIGIKRMLITIPLALLVVHFLNKFKLIQIFQSGRAAIACLAFAALPHLVTAITTPDSSAKPTVVLITLDSVRLDHLGWGGSELPTSPKLDALAANGVRFTHNISQSSWTKPSTATLLTGLVPNRHHANSRYSPLIKSQRTLAEVMSLAGYRTRCYSSNPNITPTFGFMQGFEFMHHDVNTLAEQMVAEGEQWLNAAEGQASFLYLHLNDAHYPYAPREPYAGLFNKTNIEAHLDGPAEMDFRHSYGETFTAEEVESLRLSYAEEIKYLDDIVGDFVEKIMSEH
ncbi:MAG: sulfatase-like hydrolase/transferase, partial [Planctomycetota bacterium]|nr:sulfatase-like hydrolase/transferase [Planctomycetota bacterium]